MTYPQNDGFEPVNANIKRKKIIPVSDVSRGTFTPVLRFGGDTTGITYSTQTGYYVESGDLVHIDLDIILTSKGSAVGAATITGLPFTAMTGPNHQMFTLGADYLTFPPSEVPKPRLPSGSSTLSLVTTKSGAVTQTLTNSDFENNTTIEISGSYMIETE